MAITAGFPVIGTFNRDTWNNIDLVFDFATQTYSIQLNGATVDSNIAFCGDNGFCTTPGNIASFENGLFDSSGGGDDFGFIDNYNLQELPGVPEPGSIALLGTGLLGLAGVLRRKLNR